ncbi:MAG: acyl carrier protein [Verrucomicrobiales bacterium]|nr:acyl carrier protein [Verrucomicrobiales bacterium]
MDLQDFVIARLQEGESSPRSAEQLLGCRFEDTGLDSLDLMHLIMAVEETYGISIDDGILRSGMTVAEFIAAVRKCPPSAPQS